MTDLHDGALAALGWGPDLAESFARRAREGDLPGRVARLDRGGWVTAETAGGTMRGRNHPRFRRLMDPLDAPTVGDWARFRPDPGGGPPLLDEVLARRSAFIRSAGDDAESRVQVVAANVDTAMILIPLDGDRNRRRTDRLLSLAWTSGATPVLLLTKADACEDRDAAVAEIVADVQDVAVRVVSAVTGEGLDALTPYLRPGRTIVLVGTSGAGKSTLANRLYGEEVLTTGEVRQDGAGRHTTTHRQLLRLPQGGLLIDTPGLRSIGVWTEGEDRPDLAFSDVEEIVAACRFSDCAHSGEPGCAIAEALADGTLSADRWHSYQTLHEEREELGRRQEAARRAAETRRGRAARSRGRRGRT